MVMVLLTTLLVPLIILTTYQHQYKNAGAFYALILFMQAGLLVVFTALDGFLFYVGWEAALIPILLYLFALGRRKPGTYHHQVFHLHVCRVAVYAARYYLPVPAHTR